MRVLRFVAGLLLSLCCLGFLVVLIHSLLYEPFGQKQGGQIVILVFLGWIAYDLLSGRPYSV